MLQLRSVSDCRQGPVEFSSGLVVKEKYTKEFQAVGVTTRPFRSLFSLLSPLLHSTTLSFSQITRLYKAIKDSTIVRDASLYHSCTDLQRGRAVTSLFRDVTIEQ